MYKDTCIGVGVLVLGTVVEMLFLVILGAMRLAASAQGFAWDTILALNAIVHALVFLLTSLGFLVGLDPLPTSSWGKELKIHGAGALLQPGIRLLQACLTGTAFTAYLVGQGDSWFVWWTPIVYALMSWVYNVVYEHYSKPYFLMHDPDALRITL